MLTSGPALDYFGGFPVVAPGGGTYSIKLGNSSVGGQAERARYYVKVPAGVNNYSLIYRYAVVFENPGHTASEQPRFEVKAFDSASNTSIPCNEFTYVASSNLPGFFNSPNAYGVKWKGWTTASIDLSGWAGHTIAVDFSSGDCSQGAHFGYGYLDMNCALFQVTNVNCGGAPSTALNAPPGFQSYSWWNANYSTQVGSGQNVSIATPIATTQYHVILTPYSGYGCPDTLTTTVSVASLTMSASADTTLCAGSNVQLHSSAVTNATSVNYNWTPSTGLSCTNCASPIAAPTQTTSYLVTVSDGNGCVKTDTVQVTINTTSANVSAQNILCSGNTGSATALGSSGSAPYSYSWNTTPAQATATATGLGAGTYMVTVTDANGCTATESVTITQPPVLNASVASSVNVSCYGYSNGSATATATGGTGAYSYSWNSTPVQTTATAANLTAGNYILTVTDANGCADTAQVSLTAPAALTAATTISNALCLGGNSGSATALPTGGTPPYSYSWNTVPVQTTAAATGLASGSYAVTVTDAKGCTANASASITGPAVPLSATVSSSSNVLCHGGNNGSATVSATGGTAPHSYIWNTTPAQTTATASNLTAGSYAVTVTDANGCTATQSVTIAQPTPALAVSISGTTMLSCFGVASGSVTANVTGGTAPYNYSWNTTPAQATATATGLGAGTYMVTVTDANGCTAAHSVTITQPLILKASVASSVNVSCYGNSNGLATATATGGTGAYSYAWNTNPVQHAATATNLVSGNYIVTITDANGCTDTSMVGITQPAVLTVTTGVANLNCLGSNSGTATALVSGGSAPYTYIWNTIPTQTTATATNLSTGTYAVSVTDNNGCIATANATVLPPSTPVNVSVIGSVNVLCAGGNTGSATALGSAGTPPYSYYWNTAPAQTTATATGLSAGTYMVTISDANGCGDTASVTITGPSSPLSVSVTSSTHVSCYEGSNGSATISATGGTAPYSYSWNTTPAQATATATGLGAGTYMVTVADANGCTAAHSVTITQPLILNTSVASSVNVSCYGNSNGSATATATGGTGSYSYAWNTNPVQNAATATNLVAGNYIVTVTDANGCTDTAMVGVSQPAALTVTTGVANLNCLGSNSGTATALISGGSAPYAYIWNTTPAQTTATATNLSTGTYAVSVTDNNGCIATANATVLPPSTPVNVSVIGSVNVLCAGGNTGTATALGSAGTPPYTYYWNTVPAQTTAMATGLAVGTYLVTISDANGCGDTASVTITQPSNGVSVSITGTAPVNCFDAHTGSATASATGGTAPYSYSWNTTPVQTTATATGLASGTYLVTVTDANGCSSSASAIITQPPVLNMSAGTTPVSCNGGSDGTASAVVTGGVAPYSYNWSTSPVQIVPSVSGLSAGSYLVSVTDANGCTASSTATISQPDALTTTMAVANLLCTGGTSGSATVTPAGGTPPYTYSWNTAPTQTTATASNLGVGTYSVTITDAKGCTASNTATIAPPATPLSVSVSGVVPVLCHGASTGSATAIPSGGSAPYSYSWNTTPAQVTATAANLPAGSYIVTITDDNGCTAVATASISQPSTSVNASTGSISNVACNDAGNGQATVIASGGAGSYSYSWNTMPVQTTATAVNLPAGIFIATVTDASGCADTQSITILQPASLTASLASVSHVSCNGGANGSITATVLGGMPPYVYSWNTMPTQSSATITNLVAGSYILTVTDGNNCLDTVHATLTQPGPLTVSANGQNILCQGGSGTAMGIATGGTAPYTYSWNTTPAQTTANASALAPGSYYLSVTDANGCLSGDSATIIAPLNALVATIASQTDVTCFGGHDGAATVLAAGGTAPYIYTWGTIPTQGSATATGLSAGTHMVTVTDSNGCSDTASVVIQQPSELQVATSIVSRTCAGSSDGVATSLAAGGTAPYSYSWNTVPVQVNDTATNLAAGSYIVTVTDALGCIKTVTASMTNYPAPTVDAGPDRTICEGESLILNASGAQAYSWSGTAQLSCTECLSPVTSPLLDASYQVIGTDINGCSDTDAVHVTVLHRLPVAVGPEKQICEGDTASLFAGGGTDYLWIPATGISNHEISDPVASPSVTTTYRVVIAQGICFRDTLEQKVIVYPRPTLDLGPDHKGIAGSTFQINSNAINSSSIKWTPAEGLSCDDCFAPVATLSNTTSYTAVVTNELGCTASDDIAISVMCDNSVLFVANTFTPNGDGNNDWFFPQGNGVKSIDRLQVFNRWGQVMYDSRQGAPNEPRLGWDGTFKGSQLSPDVFVYIIEATCSNNDKIAIKGDVTLFR